MILVEIATRSDLIAVSMTAALDYKLQRPLICVTSRPLQQEQTEGIKMDIMWRPPLPELTSGKADTDCPSQGNYCEVISEL